MNKNQKQQHPSKGTALQVAMAYAAYSITMAKQMQEMFEARQMGKDKAEVKRIVTDLNLCHTAFNKYIALFLDAQDNNRSQNNQNSKDTDKEAFNTFIKSIAKAVNAYREKIKK